MSWNYRILATEHKGNPVYSIHEVYYTKESKPNGYTANPVKLSYFENKKGLKWTLKHIKKALKKPILSVDNFPEVYKKK